MSRWYAGKRSDGSYEPFESRELPMAETHGHLYRIVSGSFPTKRAARIFCESRTRLSRFVILLPQPVPWKHKWEKSISGQVS
jgi:hypothetical protein